MTLCSTMTMLNGAEDATVPLLMLALVSTVLHSAAHSTAAVA
jgi:hypothetical protein